MPAFRKISISIADVTRDIATLLVTGPKSPAILAAVTSQTTSTEDFPWLSHQKMKIAGSEVTAIRVSYAGEAGFELHCKMSDVVSVYDLFWQLVRRISYVPLAC